MPEKQQDSYPFVNQAERLVCPHCYAYITYDAESDEIICPVCNNKITEEDLEDVLTQDIPGVGNATVSTKADTEASDDQARRGSSEGVSEQARETSEARAFFDELIADAIAKEKEDLLAQCDIMLMEISRLESEIEENRKVAEREIKLINDWATKLNLKRTERIDMLKSRLESIMRSQDKKTIKLPHGTMKLRQKPDRVEVVDVEVFLQNAAKDMVTIIPEQIKPSLTNIKKWIKMTNKVPKGVKLVKGEVEFSIKLNKEE